jgi:hypothetical protein
VPAPEDVIVTASVAQKENEEAVRVCTGGLNTNTVAVFASVQLPMPAVTE